MVQTNGKRVLSLCGTKAVYTSCVYLLRYLTGIEPENGCAIVDETGTTLYTDMRYMEAAEKLLKGTDVTPVLYKQADLLERLATYENVGISFNETAHVEYLALEKAGAKLVNVDEQLAKAMMFKNDWELSNIQKACEIAEDAYNELLPEIKEGMTEMEVAALLEYKMRKKGAQGLAFDTIVAFGAHAAVPHHETGTTKLCFGDEILIDFGCKVNGYCSDITRTCLFGDDGQHEEFKKAYASVLKAHEKAKAEIVAGMTGKEADAIARDSLKADGYGELFTHSLGHGIGLNVHEAPGVSPRGEIPLEDGMVFSDEPGVYQAGEYGIRIEDTVTLKDGKIKSFMHKTTRELLIL
ncbi:MAG: aminopeptidase P family protein [Clostridia bacterium]|nr:aminopeptidase P family protein [Clostridia bacterium]